MVNESGLLTRPNRETLDVLRPVNREGSYQDEIKINVFLPQVYILIDYAIHIPSTSPVVLVLAIDLQHTNTERPLLIKYNIHHDKPVK